MNSSQLITNAEALRLFFTDDVYLAGDMTMMENQPVDTPKEAQAYEQPIAELPKLEEPAPSYGEVFDFKYLGKNEKKILILVNDTENPVSTPQGTELLRKLVLSINLKNADFALVNYSAYTTAKFEHLSAFFSCKFLLSFGVSPIALGLAEHQLHQLHVLQNINMIFTHNLHSLDADMASKKTLWGTLKNLNI
ncbi:hypothetical protein [Pedobacter sp.]|uniref:hypothetical protein n=1 Tax=Pedobacter sp. TaxID=1411316 RepID=UPI0031E3B6E3